MEDLITYADLKNDRGITTAAGVCPGTDEFESYVNEGIEFLYMRGDWWTSVKKAQFCIHNGCIVWPRFVGRLRAMKWCRTPIPITSVWGEFLPFNPSMVDAGCLCSDFGVSNHGTSPVFRNVDCGRDNIKIRAYTQCQADLGKTVTLFGLDSNGNELVTKNTEENTWSSGIVLTLAKPFVSTTMDIRTITRVIKDETECPIRLFQYDTVNDVLIDMAVYQPSETNPQYIASKIGGMKCACPTSGCNGEQSIEVLFKLALLPLRDDTDISPIQNRKAIKLIIQSIKAEEGRHQEDAVINEARAIKEMNIQEKDFVPNDQLGVDLSPWGSAPLERQTIGWNI
jgi:hypothetical protein